MTKNYIEVAPEHPAQASVIWLHGLGASGDDFVPIVPQLHLPESMHVRFIFPHAPRRAVTLNFGYVMPAWYDIYSLDRDAKEDAEGIGQSDQIIAQLIDQEINRGIASQKIVLAGFSQGGAIALHTALHYPKPLGGVIALSTYLPLQSMFGHQTSQANSRLPIFMAHGSEDGIVPIQYAKRSKQVLEEHGYHVIWETYPMAHSVCPEEIHTIAYYLTKWLA